MAQPKMMQLDTKFALAGTRPRCSKCKRQAAPVGRRRGAAEKARKSLAKASLRLCKALAEASPYQRRLTIASLSKGLRLELISVREAQQRHLDKGPRSRSQSVRRTLRGNVWSVRTTSGWYHRVRLTLHGVAIASCRLPSRDIAVHARAEIVAAAEHAASTGGDAEAVLRAVHVAGSSFQVGSGGLGLCYQAVLDARRCTGGHRLHSKTVHSMEEAIFLRRTVADVREAGLRHVGQIFNSWSQEPRHQKGRRLRRCLPRGEAEAYAERALKRAEAREARRSAARAEGQAERLGRLSARAEAALRCVAAAAQASMSPCKGRATPGSALEALSSVKRARAARAGLSLTQGPSTGAGTTRSCSTLLGL
ncbi:COX11 [Symbiodinium sp. CCMP2592]|nr:COX11 [Symbiodinium sp. CCMP2592]